MMRLKEELRRYPGRVHAKMTKYVENYCALIIAACEDVTPEEAFLSLGQDHIVKKIRHRKYNTGNIYTMITLHRTCGLTLEEIGRAYEVSPAVISRAIRVYGMDEGINMREEVRENDERLH
jgi:hypothetical protein